ncbi:chloride channel protein, partial [Burkholderia multivorans]|nr:chloride channel protein [Burkholderia multivorans]
RPAPAAAAATDVVAAQDAGAAPADPLDTLRDEGGGEPGHRAESDATPAGAAPQRDEADTAAAADAARNGPRDTQ